MFTSRAEYRLLLRQDNADERLSKKAYEAGLLEKERFDRFLDKDKQLSEARSWIRSTSIEGIKIDHWFRRNGNVWENLPEEMRSKFHVELWPILEADFKYEGHIERQRQTIDRFKKQESTVIPEEIDYHAIHGLKTEAKQRLDHIRPRTLGQAARMSGITPADVSLLLIWMEKRRRSENAE